MRREWNHNIQYHDIVLRSIPSPCRLALDAGCGRGLLARQLAERCDAVIGIDLDREVLLATSEKDGLQANMTFVAGDVLSYPLSPGTFDFIAAVASLHHLPLEAALSRFGVLLAPGGVLAIIGLYRAHSLTDFLLAGIALPASRILRCLRHCAKVQARLRHPKETLAEIRSASDILLPGAVLRRHLLFRYSLVWRKPH